jgi:hypothetical protein
MTDETCKTKIRCSPRIDISRLTIEATPHRTADGENLAVAVITFIVYVSRSSSSSTGTLSDNLIEEVDGVSLA